MQVVDVKLFPHYSLAGVVCDTGGRAAAGLIIIIIIIITILTLNTAYPGSIWARDQAAGAGWSYWVIGSAVVYRVISPDHSDHT